MKHVTLRGNLCLLDRHSKFCLITVAVILLSLNSFAQNLMINGDFESTGGYNSNYILYTGGARATSNQRDYAIMTDPYNFNTTSFVHCTDYSGTGKMLVADGATYDGEKIWELSNGGSLGVISGRKYEFSYYIRSISSSNTVANSAVIKLNTNGTTSAPVLTAGSETCPVGAPSDWTKVTYTWTATTSSAQIWLTDATTVATGNDFALDNFSLTVIPEPLTVSYAAINPSCPGNNDGFIAVYGAGGTQPYTYSLNGGAFTSSNIFSGLGVSSNNYVSVKDAGTPTPVTVSSDAVINIMAPVNSLSVNNDTAVCSGSEVNLSVTGGNAQNIVWTALPNDPTLTSPAIANPTVTPAQTTVYTVTSEISTAQNLIFNSDFEKGNIGFSSDYSYINTLPTRNRRSYGITTDPFLYDDLFTSSVDHSGTGNMMVIDGSETNAGNDKVWSQTVPVKINTDYTFSYWIQTVATPQPAIIETQINGAMITGTPSVNPYTSSAATDGWHQVTYTWNSGINTTATITLYDRNTAGVGNDFALDDLNFFTSSACSLSKSVTVTVKEKSTSSTNVSICPSAFPYSWNGNSYPAAGDYSVTLVNAAGCDSVATLHLKAKSTSTSSTDITICPSALPYSWNGNSYPAAGDYSVTLVNATGCDSVATLHLTVTQSAITSTTNISICPSDLPYSWNGNSYTTAGDYQVSLTSSTGCDSVAKLSLTVKSTSSSSTSLSVCPSALPYSWNGNSYAAAGDYSVTLVNSAGCDSIATLHLSLKATSASTTNLSICPSLLPYTWNGNSYAAAGSYNVKLVNAAGCDSVATLNLSLKATSASTTNISICPSSLPYSWNGNSYAAAGSYNVKLVNSIGCDSIATLNLSLKATSASTTSISICPSSLPYSWNGNSYAAAGSYNVKLVNSIGCDSTATLNLSLKATSASTTNITIQTTQLPYTWNGNAYSSAGSYNVKLVNAAGCDSIATLNLSVENPSPCSTVRPPNAFTPNHDGFYDKWNIGEQECILRMQVDVYNRWGSLVYHSDNYKNDWDGTYKGKPVPDATYYYLIKVFFRDNRTGLFKGNVTIIR